MINGGGSVLKSRTIIHVDDDPAIREIVATLLTEENLGFKVELFQAENGKAAIEMLEQMVPDLVITDLQMPGAISGLEVISFVKTNRPSVPIALMSSNYPHESRHRPDIFIDKPISVCCLPYHVNNMLGRPGIIRSNCRGNKCPRSPHYKK